MELLTECISADTTTLLCQQGQALVVGTKRPNNSIFQSARVLSCLALHTRVAQRRGYVLRNASLGDFIVVRTSECTSTNLDSIAYYTPRLYGILIYLLTAIGLSPGGSSTVHIYTQTVHRTIQNKQYIEQHNNFGRVRAVPRLG